jgi:predicted RNA-binding protein YlxR (DUF448 family)
MIREGHLGRGMWVFADMNCHQKLALNGPVKQIDDGLHKMKNDWLTDRHTYILAM